MNANFIGNDPTQDDPMMVTIVIADWEIQKTLIDRGSSSNILYWFIFEKLDVSHNHI